MAKFSEEDAPKRTPIVFEDIYAEIQGGGVVTKEVGAYKPGIVVGYDTTTKKYAKVVKSGEGPNFTFTPKPFGLLWNPDPDGGQIERIILGGIVRKSALPTSTDADILAELPNIIVKED